MNGTVSTTPSDIAVRQNAPDLLRLLKARQWRWAMAQRWQKLQLAVVLVAPLLSATLGQVAAASRPWIAFLAVCLTIADTAWVDRCYKEALKAAAKASELVDVTLMRLPWSALAAGKKPTPEETERAARGWPKLRSPFPVENWYSAEVDRAPLALARAICQRTNLSYDADLRRQNRELLSWLAATIMLLVLALGLIGSQKFSDFVLAAWVPAAPFVAWALRERYRQADAVTSNEGVLAEGERLIEDIIAGRCDDATAEARSRLVQDAIYGGRARTVLLFPGLYRLRRDDAEHAMHASAKYWIEKAGL